MFIYNVVNFYNEEVVFSTTNEADAQEMLMNEWFDTVLDETNWNLMDITHWDFNRAYKEVIDCWAEVHKNQIAIVKTPLYQ